MIYTIVIKDEDGNPKQLLTFSSISQFSEKWSGSVAKSTVEGGFPISDHINVENPTFSINATITAYSIFKDDSELTWDGNDFVRAAGDGSDNGHFLVRDALTNLIRDGRVITLLESTTNSFNSDPNQRFQEIKAEATKYFDNCVITSLSLDINENTQNSAFFISLQIEQLSIARTMTTQLTKDEMQKAIIPKLAKNSVGAASTQKTATDSSGGTSADGTSKKPTDATSVKDVKQNIPADKQRQIELNGIERKAYSDLEKSLDTAKGYDFRTTETDGGILVERRGRV